MKTPYTINEIRNIIESNEYSAELMLQHCLYHIDRLDELEHRVAKRCKDAVPTWEPELREL